MTESFGKSMIVSNEDENLNRINKKPVWISRKIYLNLSGKVKDANKYPSNNYSGCKYNVFQYIFLALLSRFKRAPIVISFLSFIISLFVYSRNRDFKWVILSFTLIFSILPSLIVDIYIYAKIRINDYKVNSRYCIVFDNEKMEFVISRWRNLKVGDIVCVLDGEQFPADVVVLHSSGKKAYISSEMVDGSRLVRTCEPTGVQTDLERAIKDFILSPARITCDVPSGDINHFEGSLKWEGKPRAKTLTVDNFAQMFSRLRFANWVLAIVVYAGTDTRIAIRQHSAIENRNKYNPTTKLESTVSKVCIVLFLIISCLGINIFTNKDSNFETFLNKVVSFSDLSTKVHRIRWQIIAEFAAVFNFFVPITLTAITDMIRIVGAFRFSRNKALITDYASGNFDQTSSNDSKLNPCFFKDQSLFQSFNFTQNKTNTDSKCSSYNDLKVKLQEEQIAEPSSKQLDMLFNKCESLDSFGEVDISLIHQNAIMETQPMRLKIISLNNGQEYVFKKTQKINACPKFSIISGLLWKHHSVSCQRNEASRFSKGSIKVVRPGRNLSMTNFGLISPNKLELFHYFSVLLAISKLNVIRNNDKDLRFNENTLGCKGKSTKFDGQNNKKKIRSYYTKLLFQIKGLKNALVDLPPDPVKMEPRDVWPPLPKIKLNNTLRNRQMSAKSINDFSSMSSGSTENELYFNPTPNQGIQKSYGNFLHPALPVHLFPKSVIQLLNHIILSNQRKRILLKDYEHGSTHLMDNQELPQSKIDHRSQDHESKDYQVFDTKKVQISKEDNEEILYLLFNNIVKLTKNFYGWNTRRKYKIPNEYSLLVKNLLLESIDYSLATCFKVEKDDKNENLKRFSSSSNKTSCSRCTVNEEKEVSSNNKSSVLIDMLYAMAICNSTVPHLRIIKQDQGKGINRKVSDNCSNSHSSSELNIVAGGARNLKRDRITTGKKINYYHEIPSNIINKSLFSFIGPANSNLSNNSCNGSIKFGKKPTIHFRNGLKIPFVTKKITNTMKKSKDTSRNSEIDNKRRLYITSKSMSMGESMNSELLRRSSSSRVFSSNENRYFGKPFRSNSRSCVSSPKRSSSRKNTRITHRYNTNYEKLHKQRRVGCLNSHSREILLTKYYLSYYFNASQLAEDSQRGQNGDELFQDNNIQVNMFNSKCWKNLGKKLRNLNFSYRIRSREEKICNYNENFPKSYVQYSGIDENDLTIVHTAASCGMRLVLVNSQYVVVESLGRTVFSSLIYKSEDKAKQEISMIVKFFQKKEATLYVRGVAEHILPLLNPSLIRPQSSNSECCQCSDYTASGMNHQTMSIASQNYEDLMYKIKKLQYQGYKVFIFAKKTLSEKELAKIKLRSRLNEQNNGFRFLLDSSADEYFQKLKTNLEYLGHVGIEYRIQDKVPKSIRSMLDFGIKPWLLFNISSVNSIRLMHKIFPNYDKIPLIRLDRLPLKNKNKAMSFLSSVYNELKIIMSNNYRVVERFHLFAEKFIKMDRFSGFQENLSFGDIYNNMEESSDDFFNTKKKISNVEFLKALITISSLNGEIQLSQLESALTEYSLTDYSDAGGNRSSIGNINEDWLSWGGCVSGHGIINSLPGIVFSALQLNEIFESRDLLNYFFSVALISPFVVISNATFSDITTITNFLKNNVLPRPVILGISGNTGNVPVLSSCDISVSVSLSNDIVDKSTRRIKVNCQNKLNNNESKERARIFRLRRIFKLWRRVKKKSNKTIENKNNSICTLDNFTEESSSLEASRSKQFEISTENDSYLASESFLSVKGESNNLKKQSSVPVNNYTIQDIFKNSENNNFVITPATDVTVRKFHQIIPLLSRAGRLTTFRIGLAVFNNIFKLFYLITPNLIFQFYCEWSGTLLQELDVVSVYLMFWTILLPLIFGFYGIDVPKYLLDLPYLYNCSRSGYHSHWLNYIGTFLESLVLGIISFYFSALMSFVSPYMNGNSADISTLSASLTMYCILGTMISFLIKIKSLSISLFITILFKMCSILLTILILTLKKHGLIHFFRLYGLFTQRSYIFYLTIPLFISYVVLFNLIWKIVIYHVLPDHSTCIRDWWLIHLNQSSRTLKKPIISSLKNSFKNLNPGQFLRNVLSLLRMTFWHELLVLKNHTLFGKDNQDEYLNPKLFEFLRIPTLTNSIATKYQRHFYWKLKNNRNKLRTVVNRDETSNTHNHLSSDEYNDASNHNYHHMIQVELQPQIVISKHSKDIEDRNKYPSKELLQGKSLESGIITQNQTQNLSISNFSFKKPVKFFKSNEINYFGDNRVSLEGLSLEDWKWRVILHANIIWNPKQIYIRNLAPSLKKHKVKGIRSLQFAQSLRKFSTRELEEYNHFILEYASFLADKVGIIAVPNNEISSNRASIKNSDIPAGERTAQNNLRNGRNFEEGVSNAIISTVPNYSSVHPKVQEASAVDLNINLTNSSSGYGRISTFSEDVKSLLNPFKLTFKVSQLELEYQIERQIESYEHRNALRAVLTVISGIFLTLGPFSANVSNTNFKWVGVLSVIFCSSIFLNFTLSYIYGKNSLSVRAQLPLLITISVSSILTSSHGFALAVIYPILSFIIFRLGFIPGVYVTIIGFLSVVVGQFLWDMPSSYWIRYLPILVGINTFCGFLGYRSELLYRAQFLLETHTNDLRQRQRQILDTMLPSFIVERLLINQKNNPSFSSESVEDRGTVSILFCDIYDFHSIVAVLQPKKLISLLDQFFLTLDCLIDSYGCTKIETVFETYLVASCLDPNEETPTILENVKYSKTYTEYCRQKSRKIIINRALRDIINLLRFALQMHKIGSSFFYEITSNKNLDLIQLDTENLINGHASLAGPSYSLRDRRINNNNNSASFISTGQEMSLKQLKLKIGIHSGRVISGVVGTNKPQYALFGDTVNTASRMKSSCETGKIQVTSMTYDLIKDISLLKWKEKRSFVKGKGMMDTFTLESVSGSAYPNYTQINKHEIRGKGVGAVQIGNFHIKSSTDFDILAQDDILLKYLARTQNNADLLNSVNQEAPKHKNSLSNIPSKSSVGSFGDQFDSCIDQFSPKRETDSKSFRPPPQISIPCECEKMESRFSHEYIPQDFKPNIELRLDTINHENREEIDECDPGENMQSPPISHSEEDKKLSKAPSSFGFLNSKEEGIRKQASNPFLDSQDHHTRTISQLNKKMMKKRLKNSIEMTPSIPNICKSQNRSLQSIQRKNSNLKNSTPAESCYYRKNRHQRFKREKISDLMSLTLGFKNHEIEQKYLITYYSDLTTLKTIEESLVIVIVTLVLQTLIYTVLPCGQNHEEGISGFRILWTVRIIYISSVFLSWLVLFSTYSNYQIQSSTGGVSEAGFVGASRSAITGIVRGGGGGVGEEARQLSRDKWKGQLSLENTKHVGGPILFLNAVLAGGASMLMLTILWQFTMVDSSISLWCDEEILELLLLATVHHNAGLLFRYIVLFDLLIMLLLLTIFLVGINVNLEGIVVYCVALLINIIAAYSRERTGRAIFYGTLVAGNCEQKAEELLVAMLPRKVLVDFQEDKLKLAYIHKNVTFLFSDICGFTQWAMTVEAENVVYMLSSLYAQFDDSLSKFGLFKLFTIGDAYVAMSEPEIDPFEERAGVTSSQKMMIMKRKNKESQLSNNNNNNNNSSCSSGFGPMGISFGMNHIYSGSYNLANHLFLRSSSPSVLSNPVSSKPSSSGTGNSQNNTNSNSNSSNISSSSSSNKKDQQIYHLNISQMEGYSPAEGARRCIAMAHDMLQKIAYVREKLSLPELNMRIGLHYGGCIGGIVGSSRLRYEVWGHDVIIGNRMESCGTPGNITISGQLHEVLSKNFNNLFKFSYIGKVSIRKQQIDMYKTRIRRNVQLKINKVSNSENMSNLIKRNILYNNEKQMDG